MLNTIVLIELLKTIEEADVVVLMIDSQIGLSDQDKKIANLIVRRGKGIVMVINKIDELEGLENEVMAIKDKIRFFFPILSFAQFLLFLHLRDKVFLLCLILFGVYGSNLTRELAHLI